MSVIRFENVSKSFDDLTVLKNFNMTVQPAETKVVLGGSRSGKSTILKMVLGLVKPDSGRIFVAGEDITHKSEEELMAVRQHIGMVFQEGALFDSMTVGENVSYRLRQSSNYSRSEIDAIVTQVLGFVGLEGTASMMPSEMSGGMRRRVAIARALVGNPRIVLYDEPTAGLDPITARTISELIIKLRDLEGVSSIIVTHDLDTAMVLASEFAVIGPDGNALLKGEEGKLCLINTRFLMIKAGEVLFEGPDEQLRTVQDEYVKEFLN